jgi:hypothetical protein
MDIEHLGYLVKSDDGAFELTLKLKQTLSDEDARKKIEDFFDTFIVKANVLTLVNVSSTEVQHKDEKRERYHMPSLEKRQFVVLHYLPKRFTVRDYVDYYIGQGGDEKRFKTNFYATIHPLLQESRIKDTGIKKGKAIIYERIIQEEYEGQPGDRTDVLLLRD